VIGNLLKQLFKALGVSQLRRAMPQGLKWTHYFETYEAVFGARRNTPRRLHAPRYIGP
jgi:hypothetical protein